MTGLRCVYCGFITTSIPEGDVRRLRMPSATVTCPRCHRNQPAADCWVAFEKWAADRRNGLKLEYRRH